VVTFHTAENQLVDLSPTHWTEDELIVHRLQLLLAEGEKRGTGDEAAIAELMVHIIRTADIQKRDPRWMEACRRQWSQQSPIPYEPSITGGCFFGEFFDWDVPDVMQRRAKLRASKLVQDVLRHTLH
jgi:hypothetical protein